MDHAKLNHVIWTLGILMAWSTVSWMATCEAYRCIAVPFIRKTIDTMAALVIAVISHKEMMAVAPSVVLFSYLSFIRPHFAESANARNMKLELIASYVLVIVLVLEHFM